MSSRREIVTLLVPAVFLACQLTGFAAAADESEQFVQDDVLISLHEPALAISVDAAFTFVGSHPISIRDVGAGERFVFVEATDKAIRRLFIAQFEGFLPGVDDYFRYDLTGKPVVAGYPFRSNAYAFDLSESIASNPTGESASTHRFLRAKGYSVPNQWMMWRSLTIADAQKKKELILFYVEDAASTGLTVADFYAGDSVTKEWVEIQEGLKTRANRAFQVAELDEHGRPIASTWSFIPANVVP